MSRISVGVLRGGPSSEYEISLKSGATVLANLNEEKYKIKDILISKDGQWYSRGAPVEPERALRDIDVVFNALHGKYGENGEVQNLLDSHNIPYTGSRVFASSMAIHKGKAQEKASKISGIKIPKSLVLHFDKLDGSFKEIAEYIFTQFGPRYIIKPLKGGSSIGIANANSVTELPKVLAKAFKTNDSIIVQQFISGREGTCGVINDFRDDKVYALPPIEIIYNKYNKEEPFLTYENKYDGSSDEICPANFSEHEKKIIENAAKEIHKVLELSHYSRSDFIISPSGIYFLETNTQPELSELSLMSKAFEAVGVSIEDFLDHILTLAINKK